MVAYQPKGPSTGEVYELPTVKQSQSIDQSLYRIIDANANRCREALRVAEDIVRFCCGKKSVCLSLKRQRHVISKNCDILLRPYLKGIAARDVSTDPGSKYTTRMESRRSSLKDVLVANFRRSEESLRVLEEIGKLIDPNVSKAFKRSRFRIYDIEKKCLTQVEL